ncbi:PDZ and LIM domain protein 2 isoform X1 [Hemiscyllium ocellatum]|uniref:PDZ and LIM domain protein 2 isoform X1 n=2 Tax=Hemiscyllium ocellatum TaxID=170820 RepID=UPI002965F9CF|nr:PDZ and LIM domain protein 2 isoform X1 [Hemiscyllium ocellatum]
MSRTVKLCGPGPWGFRITGGRDFHKKIAVSKVTSGSKADLVDLRLGDLITSINGTETSDMLNMEAQNRIRMCEGDLILNIERPEAGSPGPLDGSPTNTFLAQRFESVLHTDKDENKNLVERRWSASNSPRSPNLTPVRSLSPAPDQKSISPNTNRRSVSPAWSSEEKEETAFRGNMVPKGFQAGIQVRRSVSPVSSSYSVPRVSHSTDSSPSEVRHRTEGSRSPSSAALSKRVPDRRSSNHIDIDSEVYKMIQENRAAKEPPRQSNRFRQLQEALDADQDGAVVQFPGRFSPSAPNTPVPKYRVCEKCGSSITTEMVKIRDGCYRHQQCYACTDCGLNLSMRGHFWFQDQMYCEKHAQKRFQEAEGSS